MQEEVENRDLTLVVSGTKFTGRCLRPPSPSTCPPQGKEAAKAEKPGYPRDSPRQTDGEAADRPESGRFQHRDHRPSIKEFEKIARKYGVDYAVKKDRSSSPPKYLIFFKGRDADALTAAFTEYTGKKVRKAQKTERPSVLAKLSQFKELVKHAVVDRNKRKELER